MARIKDVLIGIILVALAVLPACAEGPDWSLDTPPSGDLATKEIAYEQPNVTTGKAWFLTHGNVVPCGMNGGYPGMHNVFVSTYDPDLFPSDKASAAHVPAPGVKVAFWCSGNPIPTPGDEYLTVLPTWPNGLDDSTKQGVDFPVYKQNTCKVQVYNGDGYPSAIVSNIHTRHADDTACAEKDRNYGHWSYVLHFTLVDLDAQAPSTPTLAPTVTLTPAWTETPTRVPTWTPVPTITPTMVIDVAALIREAAWNRVGVDWIREAAFHVYAQVHGLGIPMSNEFDLYELYRIQAFAGGIVYARIGDWQGVRHLAW